MSKIREILCMHHSHLDVGYTHPQGMLMELQTDYINRAIELCDKTADFPIAARFRWTCEATYPLTKWIKTATSSQMDKLRGYVREGLISIAALPMHTTPGCTTGELVHALQSLDELRRITGSEIKIAINHDVNGQPWTLSSLLIDSGVEFYMTGINIHFGGIPMQRPAVFNWVTPDGRSLLSFVGEHYSLFSQFFYTHENSTEKMHQGICDYVSRIESTTEWDRDFLFLSATNPPLYDNNCPDFNLPELINRYNSEDHEFKVSFVTPEMLYDRITANKDISPKHMSGDWNDYWNFGSASTARETKISRKAKSILKKSDFLEAVSSHEATPHYRDVRDNAYLNALLYDEHTWGSCVSVTQQGAEEVYSQENQKKEFAYRSADLAAYMLGTQMELLADNPYQSDNSAGIVVVNPNGFETMKEVFLSDIETQPGRTLAALRMREYLPYQAAEDNKKSCGWVKMPPYSVRSVRYDTLKPENIIELSGNELSTEYYTLSLDDRTKRIMQITDNRTGRKLLSFDKQFGFLSFVREAVNKNKADAHRSTIFPRDVDLGNKSISQWNTKWPSAYEEAEITSFSSHSENGSITLEYTMNAPWLRACTMSVTVSNMHDRILLDINFDKPEDTEPCALYLVFPLLLKSGWECVYDTADTFVYLDKEQLGSVCRDFMTVDKTVSLFDVDGGVTLSCPDAPMVMPGDFNFGRERKSINRDENPYILAWPMNNYWDTNFAYSQNGRFSFHYELTSFAEFSSSKAYKAGIEAADACIVGTAVNIDHEKERTFVQCSENSEIIHINKRDDSVFLCIKNLTDTQTLSKIRFSARDINNAFVCDIGGKIVKPLSVNNNSFEVSLLPNAIVFVCIKG